MKLQELLKNIEPVQIIGDADVEVTGVNIDSRKIKEGHLFVAMKGTQVDGHKFIPKALELGAKSVLCWSEWWLILLPRSASWCRLSWYWVSDRLLRSRKN